MSKSLADIAESVQKYSASELRALMEGMDEITGLGEKPFPATPETLASCYLILERNARNFAGIPIQNKENYRIENMLVFGYTEFQAGWQVLRSFKHTDQEIRLFGNPGFRYISHAYLSNFPQRFPLFAPQREAAINAFVEAGFIPIDFYLKL